MLDAGIYDQYRVANAVQGPFPLPNAPRWSRGAGSPDLSPSFSYSAGKPQKHTCLLTYTPKSRSGAVYQQAQYEGFPEWCLEKAMAMIVCARDAFRLSAEIGLRASAMILRRQHQRWLERSQGHLRNRASSADFARSIFCIILWRRRLPPLA